MSEDLFSIVMIAFLVILGADFLIILPKILIKIKSPQWRAFQAQKFPVILLLSSAQLDSINDTPCTQIEQIKPYYGWKTPGTLTVYFRPIFAYAGTTYSSNSLFQLTFNAKSGKVCEICFVANEPKNTQDIVTFIHLQDNKTFSQSNFYMVVKDISQTSIAKKIQSVHE